MEPCKDCPFRKNDGVSLRPGRATQFVKDIPNDKYFPCHKSIYEGAQNPICRGALTMLHKQGVAVFKIPHVQMAKRLGLCDPTTNHELVWDSLTQMEENAI